MLRTALTVNICKESQLSSTMWTICALLLVLRDAALTEHFATTFVSMLLRLSGYTKADETLEAFRRILQPVLFIATNAIGRHILSLFLSSRKKGWICLFFYHVTIAL